MNGVERGIIHWGKILFERHLISGWGGNLSCRLGENEFLITGQHAPLGFLTSKDLVRIDEGGTPISGKQHPSSETPMHLAVYRGTEARAIVHAHPPAVLAFSLTQASFIPISYEEKYTIGNVPIIEQDTPTVTKPDMLVQALQFHPVVILKGHGTVACGKNLQEAFLLTDLLEEAVRCQFYKEQGSASFLTAAPVAAGHVSEPGAGSKESYVLFSKEHMTSLVSTANGDSQFRNQGKETGLSTSLTLLLEETGAAWTVRFVAGEITQLDQKMNGEFMISGSREWWSSVFNNQIDPFFATQQGKLKLQRGELAKLSQWYKPFERAFSLWQTIPVH